MKEKLKKKTTLTRGKTLILSLIVAIVLWAAVVYTVNPDVEVNLTDLQVRVVGETALRERGLVWVDKSKLPEFSVRVSGKRSDLIDAIDRVRVDIDVSDISGAGNTTLMPTLYLPQAIALEKQRFGEVEMTFETLYQKEIPVTVKQSGALKERLVQSVPEIQTVSVTGAKAEIDEVASCQVPVDISELAGDKTMDYSFVYVDASGSVINKAETLACGQQSISVANKLFNKKTVPVKVELDQELLQNYVVNLTDRTLTPAELEIGVRNTAQTLEEVKVILRNADYAEGYGEYTLIPEPEEDVYIPWMPVKIKGEMIKKIQAEADISVAAINLQPGLTIKEMEPVIHAKVFAPSNALTGIKATVDVGALGPGQYQVPLVFENTNISAIEPSVITVIIE